MFNRKWGKEVSWKKIKDAHELYKIFLSGSGGRGKKRIICLIRCDVMILLQQYQEYYNEPVILLTASTGPAALKIGDATINSTFQLSHNDKPPIEGLSWQ